MSQGGGLRVAVVGLRFGAQFVPIYQRHPSVAEVIVCDVDAGILSVAGDHYGVSKRYTRLLDVLDSREIDAVHLATPIPMHGVQSLSVLESGKHCACAVPMAISLDEIQAVVNARRRLDKCYMMMETAVYTRQFLYAQDLVRSGELGTIQLLQGTHMQDMENWPSYWMGLPPMYYATHTLAPLLALAGTCAKTVHCLGSGSMRQGLVEQYGNRYPVEMALFELEGCGAVAAVTRSLFQTARSDTEGFSIYGDRMSFEWQQLRDEKPVVFRMEPLTSSRGRPIEAERVDVPDRTDSLPEELACFTQDTGTQDEDFDVPPYRRGGNGGSYPHLVHEFVMSIIEHRASRIDAPVAGNWTAAGICAHKSALSNGDAETIPVYG